MGKESKKGGRGGSDHTEKDEGRTSVRAQIIFLGQKEKSCVRKAPNLRKTPDNSRKNRKRDGTGLHNSNHVRNGGEKANAGLCGRSHRTGDKVFNEEGEWGWSRHEEAVFKKGNLLDMPGGRTTRSKGKSTLYPEATKNAGPCSGQKE